MPAIRSLAAQEILDSRGRPTIAVCCTLASGASACASVPSGASTGSAEALELRDGDPKRYKGLGCRRAVANVRDRILSTLRDKDFTQSSLDRAMLDLDGTPDKSNVGANAILAVSIAFARATAKQQNKPLYAHFASLLDRTANSLPRL